MSQTLAPMAAQAQEAPAQSAAAAQDIDPAQESRALTPEQDIVVTGTRVVRDGYEAPTPTTVISSEVLTQSAQATVVDFVNTLPSLAGSSTPRNTGPFVGGGLGGANLLNLRSLGVNRTLVLLDGRRVVGSATNGAVDVNILPTGLVSRVDVVTGGASAAWGSDAVAGVVNFVLDNRFSGVKGEAVGGVSEYGDARQLRLGLSAGSAFAGGRGHILVSGEYVNNGAADYAGSRDWFDGSKVLGNPAYVPGNGQPRLLVTPDVGLSTATIGGLITAGPLRGTYFTPGGAPAPFDFGQVAGNLKIGGMPSDLAGGVQLLAPLRYYTAFGRVSYEVIDGLELFVEGNYGLSESEYRSVPYLRLGNITIQRDNGYLDPQTAARMDAAGVTSFTLGRANLDFGYPKPFNRREVMRGVVGLSGELGGGIEWDIYYQHGRTDVVNAVSNNPRIAQYNLALDTVRSGGSVVCRSTLTSPGNGCVPLNLFGFGSPSPQALAYIIGTARQDIRLTQDVAAATLRGDAFSLPAGPISFATGVEWRREGYEATADALSQANGFWVGNYKPSGGNYSVKEGFAEIVAPIFKTDDFLRTLDVNAAVRVTDYSTSGSVTTWKLGASADLASVVRLRGTVSRDIRAPNLNDLFLGGSVISQFVTDTNGASYFTLVRQTGNPALTPEKADTISGGIVLSPVPGLNLSVDYFRITIDDAIATLTAQQAIDGCARGTQLLCDNIIRTGGPGSTISEIRATGLNLASERASGVDIEASYRSTLEDMGIGTGSGMLTLRSLFTYTKERVIELPNTRIDYAGEVADFSLPHWRGLVTANYSDDVGGVTLTGRYVGPGKLSNTFVEGVDINDNSVPSAWFVDANVTVKVGGRPGTEFFLAVQNLFDKAPPVTPAITFQPQTSYGVNPTLYDTLGRQFLAGFRFKL